MEITVNITELATELATNQIFEEQLSLNPGLTEDEIWSLLLTDDADRETLVWKTEMQDKFNELYDKYWTIIEKTKVE